MGRYGLDKGSPDRAFRCPPRWLPPPQAQGCSKVGPGHARNSELPPITPTGADNQAGRPAGRLRHGLFPICEYRRHLRLRNSDFGLLSGFGLRSSDFRAAEPDLPSTGRTLDQPCRATVNAPNLLDFASVKCDFGAWYRNELNGCADSSAHTDPAWSLTPAAWIRSFWPMSRTKCWGPSPWPR